MKRIVTGHYADPTSTRTILEILSEEFDVMKDSVQHIKKKYGFIAKLSNDEWRKQMSTSKTELTSMPLDEFVMSDDAILEGRKVLVRDLDILTALEARIILLVLSSTTSEISELSGDEFRVLVDAVRHYCLDLTNIMNSDKEELMKSVEKINEDNNLIDKKKLDEGLDKITTEEYKEKIHQKVQVLYSILESINQPYKSRTPFKQQNPTSIN